MTTTQPVLVHGTAIAVGPNAVLIRGRSGSGKSDLALRCLNLPIGPLVNDRVLLVADDQLALEHDAMGLLVKAPQQIRGKIEVRGVGIVTVETIEQARLCLVADLVAPDQIDRMPAPQMCDIDGVPVPRILVAPFEASAPLKILLGLKKSVLRQR